MNNFDVFEHFDLIGKLCGTSRTTKSFELQSNVVDSTILKLRVVFMTTKRLRSFYNQTMQILENLHYIINFDLVLKIYGDGKLSETSRTTKLFKLQKSEEDS